MLTKLCALDVAALGLVIAEIVRRARTTQPTCASRTHHPTPPPSAASYWRVLERGHYIPVEVCPAPLTTSLVQAMQRCLDAPDLALAEIHKLRKILVQKMRDDWNTAKEAEASATSKAKLAQMMRKIAVYTGPNFKDHLRASVLASSHYPTFLALARQLIHDHLLPHLADQLGERSFAVQRQPSMRFNLPGSSALGARKEDTDEAIGMHTDGQYGHQPGEMNFLLSLTDIFDTNGLFVESEPELGDFAEVKMGAGAIFAFAGVSRRHYNKRNATGAARVSIDFRIIPMSMYDDGHKAARAGEVGVHAHRFTLESYFELVSV